MPKAGRIAADKLRAVALGSLAALFILPMTREADAAMAMFT